MSNSGEEGQETYSGLITKKKHQVYIKIECLRGYTIVMSISENFPYR